MRRLNGGPKGGAPEAVYGRNGLPLIADVSTTPEDFAELVGRKPGKYRLDAQDEDGKVIAGTPAAYVVVTADQPTTAQESPALAATDAGGSRAFEAMERGMKTLADTIERQSTQVTSLVDACARLVNAVDIAGVSKRELPPTALLPSPVVAPMQTAATPTATPTGEPQPPQPTSFDRFVELAMPFIGPMLPQLGALLMSKLAPQFVAGAAAAPPTAAPPPAAAPPAGGAS